VLSPFWFAHPGVREQSLFRAGEGVDDIRKRLRIFGKCWRRGYGISTEKKRRGY